MASNPASIRARRPVLPGLTRRLGTVHRWLAIAVGLLLVVWIASGIVLSFHPFPALPERERLARSEPLVPDTIGVSPQEALAAASSQAIALRLIMVGQHPRYVVATAAHGLVSVDARTGAVLPPLDAGAARAIAAEHAGVEPRRVDGPLEFDGWTVHDRYRPWRPFFRVALEDAERTDLYVSARTGEVVQRARRTERMWNRVGARVHWLNVGVFREHFAAWHAALRTLATLFAVLVLVGIWLGITRTIDARRLRRPGGSPFRGLLRVHHIAGLFAAIILAGAVSSGWLSLDRGTLFSGDQPSEAHLARLQGLTLWEATGAIGLPDAERLAGARELEFKAFGGQPLIVARAAEPGFPRIIRLREVGRQQPPEPLSDTLLRETVESAWFPARALRIEPLSPADAYSLRGAPFPVTARRVVLDDEGETWVHIDAATGRVISVMDTSRRVRRWLVSGLHTFDLPLLNRAGASWHVLLVAAGIGGLLFSGTGVVLAYRRVRQSVQRRSSRASGGRLGR